MGEACDVLVVGGGMAGMAAANRAQQAGLKAIVLEQGRERKYPSNTRYTAGAFHIAFRDVMDDPAALETAIRALVKDWADPRRIAQLVSTGPRAARWLQGEGIEFRKASDAAYHNWTLAPTRPVQPGLNWLGLGGDVLLDTLERNLVSRGGKLLRGHRARKLLMKDGAAAGLEVEVEGGGPERFDAPNVVIADGGFQSDPELLKQHVCTDPARLIQRGGATGRGDGLKMAAAVGAKIVGLDRFYGHIMSADAFGNNQLWPFPFLDHLAGAGIVVNERAQRFVNEGKSGIAIANAIARLPSKSRATVIYDADIWAGPGLQHFMAANPWLEKAGATIHKADTIEELAAISGLPVADLAATISSYNDSVRAGASETLTPPRTAGRHPPHAICHPPFAAVPVVAGITYTLGGVAIDEDSRALRADDTPIQGLFAAGGSTGGLEGGPEIGYIGGLAIAAVTGLRAGEKIAADKGLAFAQTSGSARS